MIYNRFNFKTEVIVRNVFKSVTRQLHRKHLYYEHHKCSGNFKYQVVFTKKWKSSASAPKLGALNKPLGSVNIISCRKYHLGGPKYGSSSLLSDPENKGKRQMGVNFDTLGSWNNRITMPIMMEESIKMGKLIPKIPLNEIGTASLVGRRNENEDRFKIQTLSSEILCFSIYDGHTSSVAVEYVSENMYRHIKFWLTRTSNLNEVLQQSFIDINNSLSRFLNFYSIDTDNFNSGTTATVCLLRHGIELVVGHVGDTRAILCREGNAVRLTLDHSPDEKEEKKRINDKGGVIVNNSLGVPQVNGRLAMSRSIGDMDLKHFGVIAEPYIHSTMIEHGKDAFLILTSDGLSFVLNDQEMVDIVCSCPNPKEASRRITDQALQFGSEDNVTSVVVPLGAWGKYRTTTRAIPYSFGRNLVTSRFS